MVRDHRQQLGQLKALADADLAALLALLDSGDVAGVRNVLIEALPEILRPYTTAAGELAAVLFEDLRAEAGVRGVFYATAAETVMPVSQVDAVARWSVTPLADEALASTPLTRLAGFAARAIFDSSRETIGQNGLRDSTQNIGFQRMARANCCAFCGLLASRPLYMAYKSEASAGGVVGRGVDTSANFNTDGSQRLFGNRMAGGVKKRGVRELGSSTHNDCKCVVVPLYPGTEMSELARVEREKFQLMYQQSLTGDNNEPLSGTKEILAEWRSYHGTK